MMTDTTPSKASGDSGRPGRLERPVDGRWVAGVSAGIGRHFGVGAGWVRLGFVILAFFGGFGVLLYAIGWLAIPREGEPDSAISRYVGTPRDVAGWVGAGLIALAILIVLGATGLVRSDLLIGGGLLLAGILLYRGDLATRPRPTVPADAPHPSRPPAANDAGLDEEEPHDSGAAAIPPPAAGAAASPEMPVESRRRRSVLGLVTLAVMMLTVGVMATLDAAGVIFPDLRHYLAATVLVAGLGLLVGAWFGRSRGLIVFGVLVIPVLLVVSLIRVPAGAGFGDPLYRPVSVDGVQSEYELTAGQLVVDLRNVDFGDVAHDIEASVGFGELRLLLPADTGAVIDGRVGIGMLELPGPDQSGLDVEGTIELPGTGRVAIDAEVGIGHLVVERAPR